MIRRTCASYVLNGLATGSLAIVSLTTLSLAGVAGAGDYYGGGRVVTRIGADRCAQLGEGFVDVGNGTCSRVSRSLRVYVGPRSAGNTWSGRGTSSAAMRTDGMLPGATAAQHLRVRGNLDSYSPFR